MNLEQIISEYRNSDKHKKEELISKFLLLKSGYELAAFLDCIYLNNEVDPKKYSIHILSHDPQIALTAAKHLLNSTNPNDTLNTLKYYGGRIIDTLGNKLDYKTTIPLLINSYNIKDYRDAKWSISMALANIINEPVQLITKLVNVNDEIKTELLSNLKSYTSIDFLL
jgi:hypothetical protein